MNRNITELNKMVKAQNNLEHLESIVLEQLSKYESDIKIIKFYDSVKQKRESETIQIQNAVQLLLKNLKDINLKVENFGKQTTDLQELKKEMIIVQDNMQKFNQKSKMDLERLKVEESFLFEQLHAHENKLTEWEQTININRIQIKEKKPMKQKQFAFEVKEYLDFINKHGYQGGWSDEDHHLFIKVRGKIKDKQKLAEYLHCLMPDVSLEEIEKHENWYQKYLELKEKQKSVIKQWKNSKLLSNNNRSNDSQSNLSFHNIYHSQNSSKEEIKQKLKEWKQQKEKLLLQKQNDDIKKEMMKKQLEDQLKEKHRELKETVHIWKLEKKQKQFQEKLQQEEIAKFEQEQKSVEANKAIKEFQNRDNIFIKKMRIKKNLKNKHTPVVKLKNTAPRDPKRILKPTKQWICRMKRNTIQNNSCIFILPMDIQQAPKLCLPAWRKDIAHV